MKWTMPTKTFLLGEYIATKGALAIVVTTQPCFEVSLFHKKGLHGIHPDSPAGRFWQQQGMSDDVGLLWHDPYQGLGGLGASSAQFLGVYRACRWMQKRSVSQDDCLNAYWKVAWDGQGIRPSGYDVLAQSMQGCVVIEQQRSVCEAHAWPFTDIAFIVLHTGKKLPTHHHLQALTLPESLTSLTDIATKAHRAFMSAQCLPFIDAVNAYHQQLMQRSFVADHSVALIERLQTYDDVLAVKGCGAMGADTVFLLVHADRLDSLVSRLSCTGFHCVATSRALYCERS